MNDNPGLRSAKLWELDTTRPNVARIYDYFLGGKDNYRVDRDAAELVLQQIPHAARACWDNRAFLGRVVRRLVTEHGIRQFLDIGSGLPSAGNVHQVAQDAAPGVRVVYADFDRMVCVHARALLGVESDDVLVVESDVRDTERIISAAKGLLDFSEPVAVLMIALLHFIPAVDDPYRIVRDLIAGLAPGSALAISHITGDDTPPAQSLAAQEVYQEASAPAVPRGMVDILRFFDGLHLVPPGVADIRMWGTENPDLSTPVAFYGGVALVGGEG